MRPLSFAFLFLLPFLPTARAQAAGAADLRVTATRDIREAQVEGNPMFIEATVTVTASGRPRVAHETRPESLTISP